MATYKYADKTFGQAEAIFNILGGEVAVESILRGELLVTVTEKVVTPPPPAPPLLDLLDDRIVVPATARFLARYKFTKGRAKKGRPTIGYLGDNFVSWFLDKTEEPHTETTLSSRRLTRDSLDTPIIAELGGEEKAETTLVEIYYLMLRQSKGEDGVLLTNGYANIFYVKDKDGVLRAVSVYWNAVYRGWDMNTYSVSSRFGWHAGDLVFSRN